MIRLELRIDGLRGRPRLLFEGIAMTPLWMLADGAMLGLVLDRNGFSPPPLAGVWVLGPTPVPDGLGRVLTQAGVTRSTLLPRRRSRRFSRHDAASAANHRRARGSAEHGTRRVQTSRNETEGDDHA